LSGRPLASLTVIEPVAFHLLRDDPRIDAGLLAEVTAVAGAVQEGVLSGDYAGGMARFVDYWNGAGLGGDPSGPAARPGPHGARGGAAFRGRGRQPRSPGGLRPPGGPDPGAVRRADDGAGGRHIVPAGDHDSGCHARVVAGAGHMPRTHPEPFLRASSPIPTVSLPEK
jgi:hypothetical protein